MIIDYLGLKKKTHPLEGEMPRGIDADYVYSPETLSIGAVVAFIFIPNSQSARYSFPLPRRNNDNHLHEVVERNCAIGNLANIKLLHIRVLDLQENTETEQCTDNEIMKAISLDYARCKCRKPVLSNHRQ